jgi:hypothetical protein
MDVCGSVQNDTEDEALGGFAYFYMADLLNPGIVPCLC